LPDVIEHVRAIHTRSSKRELNIENGSSFSGCWANGKRIYPCCFIEVDVTVTESDCYSAASRIVADENASALQSKGVVHAVSPKAFQQVQAQGSPSATFEQDI
jgi:hypothetical protein